MHRTISRRKLRRRKKKVLTAITTKQAFQWGDLAEVGEAAGASAVAGGILGAMFGGVGAIPGAIGGGIVGGVMAALGKTSPQVKNIAANAQDTISQLNDLLKAVPTSAGAEHDFLAGFISELGVLEKAATDYDGLIAGANKDDANNSAQITSTFLGAISKVEDYIAKFKEKVQVGVYKSFVSHSKALAPVYLFIDDDVEDVEKSCASLESAIKEHDDAVNKIKGVVAGAVENNGAGNQNAENTSTKSPEVENALYKPEVKSKRVDVGDTKPISRVFKALNIEPNEKRVEFLKDLMEN